MRNHSQRGGTPLKINIRADVSGDELVVSVENSGHFSAKGNDGGHGIGLSTIRRRLDLHYPGRHSFTINETGGTVKVQIRMTGRPWSA